METKEIELLSLRIKLVITYQFILFFVIIMLIGSSMNMNVKIANGGRMPVQTYKLINSSGHFNFTNPDQVEFYYLTDIFNFSVYYFSIGDFVIYFGFFGVIIYNIKLLMKYSKDLTKLKKQLKGGIK